jgi:hypothetical protein
MSRVQGWWRFQNPYWPGLSKPAMGLAGGAALLDGVAKLDVSQTWDLSPLWTAAGPRIGATLGATGAYVYDRGMLPAGWDDRSLTEVHGSFDVTVPRALFGADGTMGLRASGAVGLTGAGGSNYGRAELAGTDVSRYDDGASTLSLRVYGAAGNDPPAQAALHLSASDPLENFDDNWYRPRGSILTRPGVNYVPLGGAGLRGYDPAITVARVVAGNAELARRLAPDVFSGLSLWGSLFGDAGFAASRTYALDGAFLADAGAGVSLRGKLYDRDVTVRLDAPVLVHQPALAGGGGLTSSHATVAARWTFSFGDLW